MEAVFQEVIAAEKQRGRSVLLSSHILSEVEALADRVSIIRDGAVVQTGTLDELQAQIPATRVRACCSGRRPSSGSCTMCELDGHRLSATVERDHLNDAMAELSRYGITRLNVAPPSLESLFLRQYDGLAS